MKQYKMLRMPNINARFLPHSENCPASLFNFPDIRSKKAGYLAIRSTLSKHFLVFDQIKKKNIKYNILWLFNNSDTE